MNDSTANYFIQINKEIIKKSVEISFQNNPRLFHNKKSTKEPTTQKKDTQIYTTNKSSSHHPAENGIKPNLKPVAKSYEPVNFPFTGPSSVLISTISSDAPSADTTSIYSLCFEKNNIGEIISWTTAPVAGQQGNSCSIGPAMKAITFHKDTIYGTIKNELLLFNNNFELIQSVDNAYLEGFNTIFPYGNQLFIQSPSFDSFLVFDCPSQTFTAGYQIKHNKTANCIYLAPFNPNSGKGPRPQNAMGLKNLFIRENRIFFSCLNYDYLFSVEENGAMHLAAPISLGAKFIRPYKKGFLMENSVKKCVEYFSLHGKHLETFLIDTPICENLKEIITTDNVGERGGDGEELIIAAFLPATIAIYQSGTTTPVITMNLSNDIQGTIDHVISLF